MPWFGLQCVIVAFPSHIHLLTVLLCYKNVLYQETHSSQEKFQRVVSDIHQAGAIEAFYYISRDIDDYTIFVLTTESRK